MTRSYLADTAWWLEMVAMHLENELNESSDKSMLYDARALKSDYWRRLCLNRLHGLPMPPTDDELLAEDMPLFTVPVYRDVLRGGAV